MSRIDPSVLTVASELKAEFHGDDRVIKGLAPLGEATGSELTFSSDPVRHSEALAVALEAGAVVLFPSAYELPDHVNGALIVVENPRASFAAAVTRFFQLAVEPGIAATAIVHSTAVVAASAHVGAYTVIGPGAVVGEGTEIRAHVVIASGVRVGSGCLIKSHAVVGEEGFGVDKDDAGNNVRLPHLGSVVLGDHVEVGNFTTVCSGTITPTTVGNFTKIDDHVHISHNCHIGSNAIITACAEISGSVTIGDEVWIGPNASLIQGISVGARALIGIGAVVTRSVPENEVQFGNPAKRIRDNNQ
jgi:UDP-3-O-[3-hydroxymyristoyl] glucosamine N-acyltransferase